MLRTAIGDIHLSGFQSDTLDSNDLPKRLGYIIKTLDHIVEVSNKRNIYDFDILGDLINDKNIIYTVAQDAFKDFLLRHPDCNFVIISGNHDFSSVGENQKSAISVFSEYGNVQCIVNKPEDNVQCGITYVPFSDKLFDIIKTLKPNNILVSHLGLNEAMLQSGLSKVDKITLRDISKFKLAILGHYHKPQNLGSITNVWYAGSIISKDWNDKNEQKRFLIYNTNTLEVESIPIKCNIPEYHEYIIETSDQKNEILKQAEIDRNQGHHVRIRNKTSEKISEETSGGVLVLESAEIDITNRGINVSMTKEEQLKKYIEIKNIPENERAEYLAIIAKYDLLKKEIE